MQHRTAPYTALYTALFTVLLACAAVAAQAAAESAPEPDPIGYSGHGHLFAPGGREISLSTDFVRASQAHYARQIHRSASPRQRAAFDLKASYLADVTRHDEQAALYGYTLLLEAYNATVQPAEGAKLGAQLAMLRRAVGSRGYKLPASIQALLQHAGVVAAQTPANTPTPADVLADRKAYIKTCRDAGVPVPDVYELGGSGWTDNKELTTLFIGPGDSAKVAYISSATPEGVCIALPRFDAGSANTVAVGLICMGSATSKACFFDDKTGVALNAVMKLTDFASNKELEGAGKDVCTDCHAGENAFVIHPDAAAFKGIPNRKPKDWYQPLVVKSWPQNPGPGPEKGKCNAACHKQTKAGRLPAVSTQLEGYCGTVLTGALADTMSAYNDLAYSDQIKALLEACKKAPP